MLFVKELIENKDLVRINDFFNEYDKEPVTVQEDLEIQEKSCITKYISSLVSSRYQKAIEDIENTKVGSKLVRKKTLQQVMQESFFYGANRFGNNYIA